MIPAYPLRSQSKQKPLAEPRTVPTASNSPMPPVRQRRTTATQTQSFFQPSARTSDRRGRRPLSGLHRSFTSAFALVFFALAIMDKLGGGVQAAFAPADSAALKTAVGTCAWNGTAFVCTGGCLGEIFAVDMNHSFVPMNGSCPNMTASNDATGNPYGPMEDWDVSQVTSFDSSTPNLYLFVFLINCLFLESLWFSNNFGFLFFSCSGSTSTALTYTPTAFRYATKFNADISKWDTARVTTMYQSTSNFHLL